MSADTNADTSRQILLYELEQYDANVAALRAGLDTAAFEAAWNEGRALTLEQAVTLALEETQG